MAQQFAYGQPLNTNWYGAPQEPSPEDVYQQKLKEYRASLINPEMPEYGGIGDANGLFDRFKLNAGNALTPELMNMLSGINLDKRGLNAIRDRALTTGQSPWATMMLEKQGVEQATRGDELSRMLNAGAAKGMSELGVRGGANRGARERMATKSMLEGLLQKNELNRAGQAERLGIMTTDEAQKLDLLKGLPGMEIAALAPEFQKTNMWATMANQDRQTQLDTDKFNISNLVANQKGQNEYNLAKWSKQMEAWAADMQAQAQEHAGKK
jgi:hypothetical protein